MLTILFWRNIMPQELLCVDSKKKVTSICPAVSATEKRGRAGAHSAVQVPCAVRSSVMRVPRRRRREGAAEHPSRKRDYNACLRCMSLTSPNSAATYEICIANA